MNTSADILENQLTMAGVLRAAIRDSGRPMVALATDAGIDVGMVSRFVRGHRDLQLESAQKLANVLNLALVPTRRGEACDGR